MDLHDPVHKKVIGVTFIVFSVFSLVGIYFYDLFMEWMIEMALRDEPDAEGEILWVFDFIASFVWAIAILFLIPRLILGIALVTRQKWAELPSLVYGIISLINFPVGTALGVYCILVFTAKKKPVEPYEQRSH